MAEHNSELPSPASSDEEREVREVGEGAPDAEDDEESSESSTEESSGDSDLDVMEEAHSRGRETNPRVIYASWHIQLAHGATKSTTPKDAMWRAEIPRIQRQRLMKAGWEGHDHYRLEGLIESFEEKKCLGRDGHSCETGNAAVLYALPSFQERFLPMWIRNPQYIQNWVSYVKKNSEGVRSTHGEVRCVHCPVKHGLDRLKWINQVFGEMQKEGGGSIAVSWCKMTHNWMTVGDIIKVGDMVYIIAYDGVWVVNLYLSNPECIRIEETLGDKFCAAVQPAEERPTFQPIDWEQRNKEIDEAEARHQRVMAARGGPNEHEQAIMAVAAAVRQRAAEREAELLRQDAINWATDAESDYFDSEDEAHRPETIRETMARLASYVPAGLFAGQRFNFGPPQGGDRGTSSAGEARPAPAAQQDAAPEALVQTHTNDEGATHQQDVVPEAQVHLDEKDGMDELEKDCSKGKGKGNESGEDAPGKGGKGKKKKRGKKGKGKETHTEQNGAAPEAQDSLDSKGGQGGKGDRQKGHAKGKAKGNGKKGEKGAAAKDGKGKGKKGNNGTGKGKGKGKGAYVDQEGAVPEVRVSLDGKGGKGDGEKGHGKGKAKGKGKKGDKGAPVEGQWPKGYGKAKGKGNKGGKGSSANGADADYYHPAWPKGYGKAKGKGNKGGKGSWANGADADYYRAAPRTYFNMDGKGYGKGKSWGKSSGKGKKGTK